MRGIDYAFSPHPPAAAIQAAGFGFVGRYVSSYAPNDTNGKNLPPGECRNLLAAGLGIVLFCEESASRMLGGHPAGVADAQHFDDVTKALGMPGIPAYYAADFDAAPGTQTAINAYLDGASSVRGHALTGIYGGYYVVKRTLDAGKATYACQTVAWSGGQWDGRAQHLQIRVAGVSVDLDDSTAPDFGQWPRPQPHDHAAPDPPVARTAGGKESLRQAAHHESTSVPRALWLMAHDPDKAERGRWGRLQLGYLAAEDWDAPMPSGMTYWVG
jgi:hypothetical protein